MRKFTFILLLQFLICDAFDLNAQTPPPGMPNGVSAGLMGQVIDANTEEILQYVCCFIKSKGFFYG